MCKNEKKIFFIYEVKTILKTIEKQKVLFSYTIHYTPRIEEEEIGRQIPGGAIGDWNPLRSVPGPQAITTASKNIDNDDVFNTNVLLIF